MADTRNTLTVDEFLALPEAGERQELWYGRVRQRDYPYGFLAVPAPSTRWQAPPVTPPPGCRHGQLQVALAARLDRHVREHDLGCVLVESGFLLARDPDLLLGPDVAFVQSSRIPAAGMPQGHWHGAPDLCAEVVSPSDTYAAVQDKAATWLRHGTRMVLVVEPASQRVTVHRGVSDQEILGRQDVLRGADVVPGWRLPLRQLFVDDRNQAGPR